MIIDEVTIHLKAGKGGDGCNSFIIKRGVRIGSGGDGSRGANIVLKVSPHVYDLGKFKAKKKFSAKDGNRGLENNKSGKVPRDLVLDVPAGTIIRNRQGGIISDMIGLDSTLVIVKGGKPGKGNYKRRHVTYGEPGEERDVILDYRIPNDVAILGVPNSGKTSVFNALTGKHFKVNDYPFTTTSCMWAQFEFNFTVFTVLDMPALISKSHEGRGLGNTFLKHLYRTKAILITADAGGDYKNDFGIISKQIEMFDSSFTDKKLFYLLTKADKIETKGDVSEFLSVSVNNKESVDYLKEIISGGLAHEKNSSKDRK